MSYFLRQAPSFYKSISVGGNPIILDLMLLCDDLFNLYAKYTYKKTIRNVWIKSSLLPPQIECQLCNCDINIKFPDQHKGEVEYPEDDIYFSIRGGSNEARNQETTDNQSDSIPSEFQGGTDKLVRQKNVNLQQQKKLCLPISNMPTTPPYIQSYSIICITTKNPKDITNVRTSLR